MSNFFRRYKYIMSMLIMLGLNMLKISKSISKYNRININRLTVLYQSNFISFPTTRGIKSSAHISATLKPEPLQLITERLNKKRKGADSYKLVIVESPSKAKTIQKILDANTKAGSNEKYEVDFCAGHIRDLPSSAREVPLEVKKQKWATLGVNIDDGFRPLYITKPDKEPIIKRLQAKCKSCSEVFLATDEDREGEAISWHLLEILKPEVPVKRAVFHEITKAAIDRAFSSPRSINMLLVEAQEARRLLDRLAGYTMSPLLWRKICPGLSAGRVQSVGLAMIVKREHERLLFTSANYWDASAMCTLAGTLSGEFPIRMVEVNGQRLATGRDFDDQGALIEKKILHLNESSAKQLVEELAASTTSWRVESVDARSSFRGPPVPFITSTLQQECSRKLGLSPTQTMQSAQRLYEDGYITYMRTDNPQLSKEALRVAQEEVNRAFGEGYLQINQQAVVKKPKNAQEAHEAIRPSFTETQKFIPPRETTLSNLDLKVYTIIYERTLASVMKDAEFLFTTARIKAETKEDCFSATFRASGKYVVFPGFLKAYEDGKDNNDVLLPALQNGQTLSGFAVKAESHTTLPPSRFSEASFIKELEEKGVGRPSTYAKIMETLKERDYVKIERSAMIPSLTAFVVVSLLEKHFPDYIDTVFTADMEDSLDKIASGLLRKDGYLEQYYLGDSGLKVKVEREEKLIDPAMSKRALLPALASLENDIGVFINKWGAYITDLKETSKNYCPLPATLQYEVENLTLDVITECMEKNKISGRVVGEDPATGGIIKAKIGAYGPYLELCSKEENTLTETSKTTSKKKIKPKTAPFPQGSSLENVTLEEALRQFQLPRLVCTHPETGLNITASIGRFGPFVQCGDLYAQLKGDLDPFTVTPEEATELISLKQAKSGVLAKLGEVKGKSLVVKNGRFGAFLQWGKANARIPAEFKDDPTACTFEAAIDAFSTTAGGKIIKKIEKKNNTKPPTKQVLKKKTAYHLFLSQKRKQISTVGLSLGEISKQLADLWKGLDDSQKKVFQQAADQYNSEKGMKQVRQKKTVSKLKQSSTEKKPKKTSGYQVFMAQQRKGLTDAGMKLGEVTSHLAKQWKALDEAQKQVYQAAANIQNTQLLSQAWPSAKA